MHVPLYKQEMPLAFSYRRVHWLLPAIVLFAITATVCRHESTYSVSPTAPRVEQTGRKGGHAKEAGEHYTPASAPHTKPAETWNFDLQRDELNFGLSDEQCQERCVSRSVLRAGPRARPSPEAEPEVEGGRPGGQGGGTNSWRHGEFHCMIYDGELYVIKEVRGDPDRSRGLAALANMYRALTAIPNPRSIPNIEPRPVAWARSQDNPWLWVMPDFDGWAYPDDGVGGYVNFRDDVRDVEAEFKEEWHNKEAKLSWRGSLAVNTDLRRAGGGR
ncbi:hypothetical protein DL766_002756 [Monosporascus sp. MC13-8B]|uniref:Uncharacterized protein n=1 Tax=Monosporascus cannonballus TaxID=155416 RepID=A0ABY0HLJ4_9PEZI|nr:hypothetical protein DL763_010703 [Monosporascus cannonballus]RYO94863.1 hypothetical protein DL762_000297 [Monosporascus cannonballus]RYP34915.1 hypothetical protein DL766_002756 [Monosporascus sp. MC13-8B]